MKNDDVIRSDECAALLRCTVGHIEELALAGEIPALKIGNNWLFLRADLLVFLAEKARADANERHTRRSPRRASSAQLLLSPGPQTDEETSPPNAPTTGSNDGTSEDTDRKQQARSSEGSSRVSIEDPPRLLITAGEAAKLLSMGTSTFWHAVKLGHLPKATKIGGLTRWNLAELRQFIEDHPVHPYRSKP